MTTSFGARRGLLAAAAVAACFAHAHPAHADATPLAVHVATDEHRLQLYERTADRVMVPFHSKYGTTYQSSPVYHNLCQSTPCTTELSPGTHVLAASQSAGTIIEGEPVVLDGPAEVKVTYDDQSALRGAGLAVSFLSATIGAGIMVAGNSRHATSTCTGNPCAPQPNFDAGLFAAGLMLMTVGTFTGLGMALRRDTVSFQVSPLVLPPPGSKEGKLGAPNGLAVTLSF